MIDEKKIKEAAFNMKRYERDGLFWRSETVKNDIDFFIETSDISIQTANVLFIVSTDEMARGAVKAAKNFESYMWVVTTSYYSMFYMSLALLASTGIKVGEERVHKVVSDAMVHFFISNKRLAKLLEDFEEAQNEAMELLGKEDFHHKAGGLVSDLEDERKKRRKYQYDAGERAMRNHAKTSLERAEKFCSEIRKILKAK